MGKLRHITFTGIDERTDLNAIAELNKELPQLEFGVLLSLGYAQNGNRYVSPEFLEELSKYKINYACHLCGKLARQAVLNDWEPVLDFCNGHFGIFKRCQLNVAHNPGNPEKLALTPPSTLEEVIIQQASIDECDLFLNSMPNDELSVLIDGSGGRGIDTEIKPLAGDFKVSYAGGINPDNVQEKIWILAHSSIVSDFCIDMESGVRTDDWFDIEKVKDIVEKTKFYFTHDWNDYKA